VARGGVGGGAGDRRHHLGFVTAAGRALPEIGDEKVQRRAGIAMYSMITMLANTDRTAYGQPLGPDGLDPDWVEQLVIFTTAGLQGRIDR